MLSIPHHLDRQETDREPAIEAVPPAIQQQISENNAAQARALRAQEKQNTDLRQQILALNQDFIERQRDFKVQESALRAEIIQARELNKGLMEENESYQMLLHEKSMNGEFMQTSIMQVSRRTKERTSEQMRGLSFFLFFIPFLPPSPLHHIRMLLPPPSPLDSIHHEPISIP